MLVRLSLESLNDLIVLWSSFFCRNNVLWTLNIKQVLSGLNSLQTMRNHYNGKLIARLLLYILYILDSCLDFFLTLRVEC